MDSRRGSSPARQGSEVVVNRTPLSKTVSASGAENRSKLVVAETRPHSAENRDTLKRDKLAEEVERIAVGLLMIHRIIPYIWNVQNCVVDVKRKRHEILRIEDFLGNSIPNGIPIVLIILSPIDKQQRRIHWNSKVSEDGIKAGRGMAASVRAEGTDARLQENETTA